MHHRPGHTGSKYLLPSSACHICPPHLLLYLSTAFYTILIHLGPRDTPRCVPYLSTTFFTKSVHYRTWHTPGHQAPCKSASHTPHHYHTRADCQRDNIASVHHICAPHSMSYLSTTLTSYLSTAHPPYQSTSLPRTSVHHTPCQPCTTLEVTPVHHILCHKCPPHSLSHLSTPLPCVHHVSLCPPQSILHTPCHTSLPHSLPYMSTTLHAASVNHTPCLVCPQHSLSSVSTILNAIRVRNAV